MATQQSIQLRNQSTQSLIASGAKASLPRFGVLHKGEKAQRSSTGDITRPGKDLSYFRLDTKFPDIEAVWNKAYPDDAAKRRINVIMPFATVDENFERCREQWVKGGLVHRCDGVTTSRMRDKQTGKMSLEPQDCPGGCELVSRMMVMIPEMIVGTLRLGLFTLNDTSKNDIARLKEELQWIYDAR
ncbi:MAG TPA: hypothetical protein VN476_05055, partial [Pyrinomonadaceae bacterium]|nr:hypothetical protein [Pyrinomonadaceae bacterium]